MRTIDCTTGYDSHAPAPAAPSKGFDILLAAVKAVWLE